MISFREYHNQMEILNEGKDINLVLKTLKAGYEKSSYQALTNVSNYGKLTDPEGKKEAISLLEKYQKEAENDNLWETAKNAIASLKSKLDKTTEENGDDIISQDETANKDSEFKNNDVESDYQWLFDNKEEISNLIKNPSNVSAGLQDVNKKLVFYFIVSDIAYQKLLRIFNDDDKTNVKINTGSDKPFTVKLKNEKKYSYENTGEKKGDQAGKVFIDILNSLKKFKFKDSISLSDKVKDYVNSHKDLDLNKPSERQKVFDDVKNNEVFNKSKPNGQEDWFSFNKDDYEKKGNEWVNKKTKEPVDNKTAKQLDALEQIDSWEDDKGHGNENKAPELSDSAKAGRAVRSDPNSTSSLTKDSSDTAIQIAIDGTFGTSPKTPGNIFLAAIEKAKKAREEIAKDAEDDDKYIKSAVDRKKYLNSSIVTENVILKELQNNPLLKEELEILQEKLFGPEGERAKTNWKNNLGKSGDGSDGDLEAFRQEKRGEAKAAFEKIYNRYVGNSTRADTVNKIQKIANEYYFELNKKVNKLIKKGNYGPITSLIRDIKVANADRIAKKNENYAATGAGKNREVEETDITNQLNKLNENPKSIIKGEDQKHYKNIFSLWAMMKKSRFNYKNLYTLDHPSKDLIEDLGPMEKNVIDKLVDFGKKYIYSGIDERLFSHVGTLLLNGNYGNLVDKELGVELRTKLENELKKNKDNSSSEEQNSKEQNSKEQNPEGQNSKEQNAKEQNAKEQNAEEQNAEEQNSKEQNSLKKDLRQLHAINNNAIENIKNDEQIENDIKRINLLAEISKNKEFYKKYYDLIRKTLANIIGYKINNAVWYIEPGETKFKIKDEEEQIMQAIKKHNNVFQWAINYNALPDKQKPIELAAPNQNNNSNNNNNNTLSTSNQNTADTPEVQETINKNQNYLKNIVTDKIRSMFTNMKIKNKAKEINFHNTEPKNDNYVDKFGSVVTEEFILTEDDEPISKSGAETAVLKALSLNAQEAAEGKQWIIDNIYKGNPLASKIVDKFVEENSNKRNQAAKALEADKQAKQQAVNNGTPQQVATAMQGTGADTKTAQLQAAQQGNANNQAPTGAAQPNTQQAAPVANNTAPTTTAPQQQTNKQPANSQATVTTAAADGFPNRLYKKIIRRKIGM